MKFRVILAVWAAKLARWGLRLLRRGATAFPGRVALRICPDLLAHLAKDVQTIVVTGTNGKTTCSRMIEQAFENSGRRYLANRSGANLLIGIVTEFAVAASLSGRMPKDYAVIECDEAACKKVLGQLKPKVLVVTNIFRDQLDRFGAITETLENIKTGVKATPDTVLCLNADCSLTASMAELPNRHVFYGVDVPIYARAAEEVSDAANCIRCKAEYEYDWRTYGHLGGFKCPRCGYHRPEADLSVTAVKAMDADGSLITVHTDSGSRDVHVGLAAGYNIYNAAAAMEGLKQMGFRDAEAAEAVEHFHCGFGRMEKLTVGGTDMRMILVKNPAGANQVLNFLGTLSDEHRFAVCLNDHAGDGTDVSWIWDADFEKLAALGGRVTEVLIAGDRAREMALRLKYAGVAVEKLRVFADHDSMIAAMTAEASPVFIMPTYSAMLELREKLSHLGGGAAFWE